MFLFSNIIKVHCNYFLTELELRQASFNLTKINSKGKTVNIGIKELIYSLKVSMHPDKEEISRSMSKSEQMIFKSFQFTYLTATEWHSLITNNSNSSPSNEI